MRFCLKTVLVFVHARHMNTLFYQIVFFFLIIRIICFILPLEVTKTLNLWLFLKCFPMNLSTNNISVVIQICEAEAKVRVLVLLLNWVKSGTFMHFNPNFVC